MAIGFDYVLLGVLIVMLIAIFVVVSIVGPPGCGTMEGFIDRDEIAKKVTQNTEKLADYLTFRDAVGVMDAGTYNRILKMSPQERRNPVAVRALL